uniref:Magnesium transporter n=1 Tax=Physcomitrium patens TaxID=3218 RepID=A0A7I4DNV2_PHYPA
MRTKHPQIMGMRPQIPQRVTEEIAMDVDTQQWRAVQSHTRHTKREKKSWLYIDVNGNHQDLEVGKQAIMRRAHLPARDLRLLDPLLSYPSSILGREHAIVVNLEHIKMIITAQEVFLLDAQNPIVAPFVQNLRRRLPASNSTTQNVPPDRCNHAGSGCEDHTNDRERREGRHCTNTPTEQALPFEFQALEVCLEAACQRLDSEVRAEIEQLLDDDGDMTEMYLSTKLVKQQLEVSMRSDTTEQTPAIQSADSGVHGRNHGVVHSTSEGSCLMVTVEDPIKYVHDSNLRDLVPTRSSSRTKRHAAKDHSSSSRSSLAIPCIVLLNSRQPTSHTEKRSTPNRETAPGINHRCVVPTCITTWHRQQNNFGSI